MLALSNILLIPPDFPAVKLVQSPCLMVIMTLVVSPKKNDVLEHTGKNVKHNMIPTHSPRVLDFPACLLETSPAGTPRSDVYYWIWFLQKHNAISEMYWCATGGKYVVNINMYKFKYL